MSGAAPRPMAADFPLQPTLPTPSPFAISVTSTRWSSRPHVHVLHLILRSLALLFSFVSALSLAAPSSQSNDAEGPIAKFYDLSELVYSFIVNMFISIYIGYQLFKSVCDMTHRGILMSDKASDYISFIVDQIAGYLLISSASVTILVIQRKDLTNSLHKATIVSVCMSFIGFLAIAACALFSGYKLCKRLVW